jgi:two-component sensor histidine kinase
MVHNLSCQEPSESYVYLKQGLESIAKGNLVEGKNLMKEAAFYAKKENALDVEAKSYINIGITYYRLGLFDSAIYFTEKSRMLYSSAKDTIQVINSLRNIGIYYSNLKQSRASVRSYLDALSYIGDSKEYTELKARLYNDIAIVYTQSGNIKKAKNLLLEGLDDVENNRIKDNWMVNLGNIYQDLEKFDSAKYFYIESLILKREEKDSVGIALVFHNLGEAHLQLNTLSIAKQYLDSAIFLKRLYQTGDTYSTQNNLAWYYIKVEQYDSARMELVEVGSQLENNMREQEVLKYYFLKRLLAKELKDYSTYILYDELHDSLSSKIFEEERLQLQEMQAEFDINQRDDRIGQQEELLAAQETIIIKNTNLLILVIIITIIVFVSAIYFVLLNSRNKKLRMRNELLVREQNHRVKNNLQMISSLLSLQAGKTQDEVSKAALKQSQGRIQAIALLNRSLYDQDEIGDIDLKVYISELITEVINSITDTEVKYHLDIDEIKLDLEKTTSLGLIINELIVNSVKYVKQSVTEFSLTIKEQSGKFSLEYTDNGENFDLQAYQNSKSFGKKLVELQAKQLRGQSNVSDDSQFRFNLNFV